MMANTSDLSAQAHLAAGMQKLEALRRQFLRYLECKEQEVLARVATGEGSQVAGTGSADLSEWLS